MGRLSQTKYYLSDLPSKLTIIRRYHPLETKELELLSGGKTWVVLRLADGSAVKILRRWTDADGAVCMELAGHSQPVRTPAGVSHRVPRATRENTPTATHNHSISPSARPRQPLIRCLSRHLVRLDFLSVGLPDQGTLVAQSHTAHERVPIAKTLRC